MQMTKELEKRLKLMQRFNQVSGKRSMYTKKIYNDKIFIHNNIMYATDGHIFVMAKNLTDQKDFSFFKCNNKKFTYLDSTVQEVKEDKIGLRDGEALERIITQFNHNTLSFDIDFEGYPLPLKLCSGWSYRWQDKLTINFQTAEAIFDFCGGSDELGGVTGTYGDIIKNVSGEIPEAPLKFVCWNIIEIMRQCKVKKIHIESYPDRKHNTCKVGDYTFYFMARGV